jgi:hypothetical protein
MNGDIITANATSPTKRARRAPLTDAHRQRLMKPRKPPLADAAQQALRERKREYNRRYRARQRQREVVTSVGEAPSSWLACLVCRSVFRNMPCFRRAHERGVRHQGRLALAESPDAHEAVFVEWNENASSQ